MRAQEVSGANHDCVEDSSVLPPPGLCDDVPLASLREVWALCHAAHCGLQAKDKAHFLSIPLGPHAMAWWPWLVPVGPTAQGLWIWAQPLPGEVGRLGQSLKSGHANWDPWHLRAFIRRRGHLSFTPRDKEMRYNTSYFGKA